MSQSSEHTIQHTFLMNLYILLDGVCCVSNEHTGICANTVLACVKFSVTLEVVCMQIPGKYIKLKIKCSPSILKCESKKLRRNADGPSSLLIKEFIAATFEGYKVIWKCKWKVVVFCLNLVDKCLMPSDHLSFDIEVCFSTH